MDKLGIRAGMRLYFADAPDDYHKTLGRVPTVVQATSLRGPLDFVQCFSTGKADLEKKMPALVAALDPAGMLWISWPKKAAKVETDLTEDHVRAIGLANGVVDVRVCAIDDVWSGLKFVIRLKDRP